MGEPFEDLAFKRQFLSALRVGMYLDEACKLVMIDPVVFSGWRTRALAGEEPFRGFIRECDKAEAAMIKKALTAIQKRGSKGDWRAAMEILKRRQGAHWNRSYDSIDGEQQRKLDELDLTPAGVQSSLDELDDIDGNVVPIRRKRTGAQEPGGVRQGGDGGDQRTVQAGEVAQAADGGTDGGGRRS